MSEDTHREKADDLTHELLTVLPGGKKRSKKEKISDIIAKRSKERNELFSKIEAQNNLLMSQLKNEDDDVDIFYKSIAMTVKKLPKQAINEAKMKTLALVNQLENNYSVVSQPTSFNPVYSEYNPPPTTYTTQSSSSLGSYETSSNSREFMAINYDSDEY